MHWIIERWRGSGNSNNNNNDIIWHTTQTAKKVLQNIRFESSWRSLLFSISCIFVCIKLDFKEIHSDNAIHSGLREGWNPIAQQGRVAPLAEHPQSPPQVRDRLPLLLASVPPQGWPKLPHLPVDCRPACRRLLSGIASNGLKWSALLCKNGQNYQWTKLKGQNGKEI